MAVAATAVTGRRSFTSAICLGAGEPLASLSSRVAAVLQRSTINPNQTLNQWTVCKYGRPWTAAERWISAVWVRVNNAAIPPGTATNTGSGQSKGCCQLARKFGKYKQRRYRLWYKLYNLHNILYAWLRSKCPFCISRSVTNNSHVKIYLVIIQGEVTIYKNDRGRM